MKRTVRIDGDRDTSRRDARDRLEILSALIDGPSFEPAFRDDVIKVPAHYACYAWWCVVPGCRCVQHDDSLCFAHQSEWAAARTAGVSRTEFVRTAEPHAPRGPIGERCRICPDRPATTLTLCRRHYNRWYSAHRRQPGLEFGLWLAEQEPLASFGRCRVLVCEDAAESPLALCPPHSIQYRVGSRAGNARLPRNWFMKYEESDLPVPVLIDDQAAFDTWCATVEPVSRAGQVNLRGLRPLVAAEFRWGLFEHAHRPDRRWALIRVQKLVNYARRLDLQSLTASRPEDFPVDSQPIIREILDELRLVYFTPDDTRQAGFIETDHFGHRFTKRTSHIDLAGVSQRWLRELLWDRMAAILRSPKVPRSGGTFDMMKRACLELSAFLEGDAPVGGHDPRALTREHIERFLADQQHRERHGLPSLTLVNADGSNPIVTAKSRSLMINYLRKTLRTALEAGDIDKIGLPIEFVLAVPYGGVTKPRKRHPFSDEAARTLADEENLTRLASRHDPLDQGMRDIWEAIVYTGRRASEVIDLKLDCLGRYSGLPVLWHDQTKVGNLDASIRIPERLYDLLRTRQRKTLARFEGRHGRQATAAERTTLALFPTRVANARGTRSLSHAWFHTGFKAWVDALDIGRCVPHQARHTLATGLLRNGATLSHIRRYLGQVSDRMAEHYVTLTQSDLDHVLESVWVSGPGSAAPGELLSGGLASMTKQQALALALDLSRRATPTEGGFCTFQPVVSGGACPWNLDCVNCDKFVLSGADLLYWQRKREQWRLLAERAPDEATADYLHEVFEPTARAIAGLEDALAALGLLDQALALDLRKPQDYFHRIWTTAFRAADLAQVPDDQDPLPGFDELEERGGKAA